LNEQDRIHEEKLASIMANAESLKGKEYIDYLLSFLKGRKEEAPADASKQKQKRKQICFHDLTAEECKKLAKTLADENMVYYFNVHAGL